MSTFYVLPSRPIVGERFARYLARLFPGLEWKSDDWSELGEFLGSLAARHPNVFVVHHDELPPGTDSTCPLMECFGAETGDKVVEIQAGTNLFEFSFHTRQLDSDSEG